MHDLLKLYNEINVPPERLLFKIPATWQVNSDLWAEQSVLLIMKILFYGSGVMILISKPTITILGY